jgi:hypothetical protein
MPRATAGAAGRRKSPSLPHGGRRGHALKAAGFRRDVHFALLDDASLLRDSGNMCQRGSARDGRSSNEAVVGASRNFAAPSGGPGSSQALRPIRPKNNSAPTQSRNSTIGIRAFPYELNCQRFSCRRSAIRLRNRPIIFFRLSVSHSFPGAKAARRPPRLARDPVATAASGCERSKVFLVPQIILFSRRGTREAIPFHSELGFRAGSCAIAHDGLRGRIQESRGLVALSAAIQSHGPRPDCNSVDC